MGGSGGSSSHGSAGRRSGGGGGSGGGGTGGGGPPKKFSCQEFETDVVLVSLRPTAAKKLAVGDQLRVRLGTDGVTVEVVTPSGDVVGNVVVPNQLELVACLKKGTKYIATVESIKGSTIIVHVSAKTGK